MKFNIEWFFAIKIATKLKTLITLYHCNFLWHITINTFFSKFYYTFLANCTCKPQTIRILSILHIENIDNIQYIEIENTLSIFSCNMHFFGVYQYFIEPIFNDWGLSISNIVLLFSIQGDIKIYCIELHSNTNLAKTVKKARVGIWNCFHYNSKSRGRRPIKVG